MKTFFISGKIEDDMAATFRDCIANEWNIQIFFRSTGGSVAAAREIIYMINQNKERITLIWSHELSSAAWMIFFYSECKRDLLPNLIGMIHLPKITAWTPYNKVLDPVTAFELKCMKKEAKELLKLMKKVWCSKSDINAVNNWMDVSFSFSEMKKMLRKHEKALQW